MNVLIAVLKDSWHEAVERRARLIVGFLAVIAILFCLSVSFRDRPRSEMLSEHVISLGDFRREMQSGGTRSTSHGLKGSVVEEPREIRAEDGWPDDVSNGWTMRFLMGSEGQLDDLSEKWQTFWVEMKKDALPGLEWVALKLRHNGWDVAYARWADPEKKMNLEIAASVAEVSNLESGSIQSLFFGLTEFQLRGSSRAEAILSIQIVLANALVGFIGMLVALLVCSGFVPSLLQKGTLDLSLARPVGRVRLLLFKYLGGLWFIGVMSVIIVVGTYLALLLRTGVAEPRYLIMIPALLGVFAILYSVEVLVGVLTRSANIAGMAGIAVWWGSTIFVALYDANHGYKEGVNETVRKGLQAVYTILPKTSHFTDLASQWLAEAQMSGERGRRSLEGLVPEVDWAFSITTTIGFAVAMLALACWKFRRTDY